MNLRFRSTRPTHDSDEDHLVVEALAAAVDSKDHYTHYHSERVASYAREIARELGLSSSRIELIAILLKSGKLTPFEYEEIKRHSAAGETIVRDIGLGEIALWVRHHHERWDGSGYPDGLCAQEIPIESRILGVEDAFDAMTHDRSYQAAIDLPEAIIEIESNMGTQFDPEVAQALVAVLLRETDREKVPA
jgi:polar amino acid transport system substrate-binding protein